MRWAGAVRPKHVRQRAAHRDFTARRLSDRRACASGRLSGARGGTGCLDPVAGAAGLVLAPEDGVPALPQTSERRPGGVRQPTRRRHKIAEAGAGFARKQAHDKSLLGPWAGRALSRFGCCGCMNATPGAPLRRSLFLSGCSAVLARRPLQDAVFVFDLTLAMRPSSAVSDGVSRRHGRNPAIGLGPAGWEGSPGSARRSRHSDACPVPGTVTVPLRSQTKASPFWIMLLLISVELCRRLGDEVD